MIACNNCLFSHKTLRPVRYAEVIVAMWPAAGDQFKEDSARERRWRSSFFNWFYFAINIGSLVRQQQQQQREG